MSCASALLIGNDKYLCNVHGRECLFWRPDSKLCAKVYNEGPDAVDSEELFKSVEKYTKKYADEEGITIEQAKEDLTVKAYIMHFDKVLEKHRATCREEFSQ